MIQEQRQYDVCIIGAGVVGCAIARELSRYNVTAAIVEQANDVANGSTKANSGIVHGGYSAQHGSLKAALCRPGNLMCEKLDRELSFGYRQTGSLVLAFSAEQQATLRSLLANGRKNGVDDLEILTGNQAKGLEPNISDDVLEALYCPSAGVTSPYEFAIALAENAVHNGVDLLLQREVASIDAGDAYTVHYRTDGGNAGVLTARYLVNAAGLYADRITAMMTEPGFTIKPRQGQYIVFDKSHSDLVHTVVFQTPTEAGKGILVTTTFHGNIMVGPNANEIEDRNNVDTDEDALRSIIHRARISVPAIDLKKAITTFAGVRAVSSTGDFVIGKTGVQRFIQAAGIDSPGLTSSPAIAERVRDALADAGLQLKEKSSFNPERRRIIVGKTLTDAEVQSLLDLQGPEQIICRCERVSRGEIEDAMARGLPVLSIDAVKRRTRAGQGRCQGSFCRPRVAALLARDLGVDTSEILRRHDEESQSKRRIKTALLHARENEGAP